MKSSSDNCSNTKREACTVPGEDLPAIAVVDGDGLHGLYCSRCHSLISKLSSLSSSSLPHVLLLSWLKLGSKA